MDQPTSTLTNVALAGISLARISVGNGTLFFPLAASKLFGVPLQPQNAIIGRLFGIRELVMGIVTLQAYRQLGSSESGGNALLIKESRQFLRKLLWVGLSLDIVDVGSCALGVWEGGMVGEAFALVGGGAAFAILLGEIGLRGLK